MLAWLLSQAGLEPGFLIGGVPGNFGESARTGSGKFFVVEADEYDSAFFDKRSKFVHYRPRTVVLNNLEFDHADIFDSLGDIQRQFHHLVRTVPGDGKIICRAHDKALEQVLDRGCWSTLETFAVDAKADWSLSGTTLHTAHKDYESWSLPMPGLHNASNALAAVAAASDVGVSIEVAMAGLLSFEGIARRLQVRGVVNSITVYDDFAHHPTAIKATLEGVRQHVKTPRVVAVLEPRSNTMKTSVDVDALIASLASADATWLLAPPDLAWDAQEVVASFGQGYALSTVDELLDSLVLHLREGDQVVIMSNGAFGGIHEKLLKRLERRT